MIMEIYYAVSLFLMLGCGFMSFYIGRKEGIIKFLEYLDANTDEGGRITVQIDEDDFRIVNDED